MEKSHLPDSGTSNGLTRTTSRKRRPSEAGPDQYESFPKPGPEAPEVPKAPPVSYREPYGANSPNDVPYSNPTSFAARARGGPHDIAPFPESLIENSFETMAETTRQNRRGSIRRSTGSKPVQNQTSSSQPDPAAAYQPASPQYRHAENATAVSSSPNNAYAQLNRNAGRDEAHVTGGSSRSETRRMSASGADPRKEWAVDRSPLQKLEGKLIDISKEEKRARVEEAERLLKERRSSTARNKRSSETNATSDRTRSRQDPANIQKRSNRQSAQGVTNEDIEGTQDKRVPSYNPRQDDLPPSNGLAQATRKQREQTTQASQGTARFSDYPEPYAERGQPQDQRAAQFERHDAIRRKSDVRFAPQEKSVASDRPSKQVPRQQQGLYHQKAQSSGGEDSAGDPVPRRAVKSADPNLPYEIPPQTAAGIAARQKVAFGGEPALTEGAPTQHHHRLSKLLHRTEKAGAAPTGDYTQQPRHLDEWRKASIARLTAADFAAVPKSIADAPNKYNAWWEKDKSSRRSIANATNGETFNNDTLINACFEPPLYLKCGPLLRFTGLQRSRLQHSQTSRSTPAADREVWRGSILIVTTDSHSDYSPVPTLELFPEHMDMLPPAPRQANIESGNDLPAAYLDPIAGLPKLTRHGGVVYVRPAEDLDHEKDLSRVESDDGLFEQTRTANVPTSYGMPKSAHGANGQSPAGNINSRRRSSQRAGVSQVKAARLHAERGVTFWRFNIEVELTEKQQRIGYRINNSASVGFWVPAKGQTMNMMFHSCNGFSMSVDSDAFSGPDPLWRDVLNNHQSRPFHVMIGGGDQIYNDRVMTETEHFQEWLTIKNPHHKHRVPFTQEMLDELEAFYLERYCMWFSQGLFGMANSQIPMINLWDDHDIIDGFGSYPHHFMSTPVFCGLGAVAFKYYMLFQHQSVPDEGAAEEPSWLMGAAPGPYINELSRSLFMFLGKGVAFLGLDCRTERMRDEILSEATYDLVFDRCRREIVGGETKHLIVLLGVPIAYPRLNFLENVLTSRVMDPIKALGRAGLLGGFINKFDGGVEILDDLDDHWTAKHHKQERHWFIQELQELAAEKSIRVTILGGDVHLAAIGQFYSSPHLNLQKDRDHRYMPNVISSAIVNTPPPDMMADIMNRRDKKHYLDKEDKQTLEDMIPMFTHDVDGKGRNNKRLLPRRNWCSIREYYPGSTPPPTPPESEHSSITQESPPPPTRLQRTLSLTRGDVKPGNLIRRLSGRARPPSPDYPMSNQYLPSPRLPISSAEPNEDYFTLSPNKRASTLPAPPTNATTAQHSSAPLPRPGNFRRRPTNMSEKAVLKGGADSTAHLEDDNHGHINLEHGLDICINCEINQKNPAGITVPYRLLVPALWYEGPADVNETAYRKKGVIERFKSIKFGRGRKSGLARAQGRGEWGGTESNYTPSISETGEPYAQQQQQQQQSTRPAISNPMLLPQQQQQDQGYPRRRLSKADRMLGTTTTTMTDDSHHPPPPASNTNNGGVVLGQGAKLSSAGAGLEPFQPRPPPSQPQQRNQNDTGGGAVVLGQGFKTSSAGSRAAGPQGLPTGNGTVKTGRSGSILRSGSRGYRAMDAGVGDEGVVLGRGEKMSSAGREVRYVDDGYGYDGGRGDEGSFSGGSEDEGEYEPTPVGKGKGYAGIEAYKEKSWRRFF
ncbi:MAG: hypothetical protein LQ338_003226 [Usnochroma carphineum]|nr:MAG: hypothetical protein LQ338_003226 [Usnochroma carphineum]